MVPASVCRRSVPRWLRRTVGPVGLLALWQVLSPARPARRPDRSVAEQALAEVGLEHRSGAWPKTLSGGEAQRASLARALVREPDLLLLDEPFGALDALTRIRAQQLVAELWQRHGCAVLLVTHDVEETLLLADRVLVMRDGVIAYETQVGLDRPRTVGGAEFTALRGRLLTELGVDERAVAHAA